MGLESDDRPPLRPLGRELSLYSSIGVLSAVVLTVSLNLVLVRYPKRWDVTQDSLYSLSEPTRQTLSALPSAVQVYVFLGQADPQFGAARRILEQYQTLSPLLRVSWVDPEKEPARFVALQSKYRLSEGLSEEGRLASDAALVLVSGEERWIIAPEDLVLHDPESDSLQPRLEQAITEGLRQLLHPEPTRVCFAEGHEEASFQDAGPRGLSALAHILRRNNYELKATDLRLPTSAEQLSACQLLLIVDPGVSYPKAVAARIGAATERGMNLLVAQGPRFDEAGVIQSSGLAQVLNPFGVRLSGKLLFERDPELVLAVGAGGEVFFASPRPHTVTRGLLRGDHARFRVLMSLAQSLELRAQVGDARGIVQTSPRAKAAEDTARLIARGGRLSPEDEASSGPFWVAAAAELSPGGAPPHDRSARLIALGSAAPLLNNTMQDPTLVGTRRFVESAISWLVSRPQLVSLEEKDERRASLPLTEGALSQVASYVLLYVPAVALLLGLLVFLRRRRALPGSRRTESA